MILSACGGFSSNVNDHVNYDFSDPEKNYLNLSKLYQNWNYRPFGGRKGARLILYSYLVDLIYNDIETEYNYVIGSPAIFDDLITKDTLKIPPIKGRKKHERLESVMDEVKKMRSGSSKEIVFSNLRGASWLRVHGDIDLESFRKVVGKDKLALRKWWRDKKLFSIKGKVKKFRLGMDRRGRVVHIYLDKVIIKHEHNTKRDNK